MRTRDRNEMIITKEMTMKKYKPKPMCGNREFTLTEERRDTPAVSFGLTGGTHSYVMHEELWICNKCKHEDWTDEDMMDGRHFCTQR